MARLTSSIVLGYLLYLPLAYCGHTLLTAHILGQVDLTNLTDPINRSSPGSDLVPTHIVELLKTLSNKPACYKAATRQLVTFCRTVREDVLDPSPSLEDLETTKSIFAASLAVCELQEANATTPTQCTPLLSVAMNTYEASSGNPLQSSRGRQVTNADIRACLRALESKPQSWTSYSNSRQHVALLCDVSRADIMKDEALNLFHLLTELGFEISQALTDALQRMSSQKEAEMVVAKALKDQHMEQLRDLAQVHQKIKTVVEESHSQLTKAVHHTSDSIRSASVSAADLKRIVEAIFLSAATGGAELASAGLRDAEANHEVALVLKEMLQGVVSNDLAIIRDGVREFIDMAALARDVIQAVRGESSGIQEVVRDTSIHVKQTAQEMVSLQESALAAAQIIQASNTLAEGMLQTTMETNKNLGPLKELVDMLTLIFHTVQTMFSRAALILLAFSAFMVTSVVGVSCSLGVRCGYYLVALYCQALAVALVIRVAPLKEWTGLALSNPVETLALLGTMAVTRLILHANHRHRLVSALRFRKRPSLAPSATSKLSKATRWVPVTAKEVPSLAQRTDRQDSHRSRRAQTTPPRL